MLKEQKHDKQKTINLHGKGGNSMSKEIYRLPADEEEHMVENCLSQSWVKNHYRYGFMRGRLFAVHQILKYKKLTGEKIDYKKLIEFILEKKIWGSSKETQKTGNTIG